MDISTYHHMNIRMSTRGKRPLRNLTPSDKVRAIQRIHNGETKASVSRDIGVPESTLRGWCKNEQKLRFMCRQLGAVDCLNFALEIENPPQKRIRFNNKLQSPKFSTNANEIMYSSRLPMNDIPYSPKINSEVLVNNEIVSDFISQNIANSFNAVNTSASKTDQAHLAAICNLPLFPLINSNSSNPNLSFAIENANARNPSHVLDSPNTISNNQNNTIHKNAESSTVTKEHSHASNTSFLRNHSHNIEKSSLAKIGTTAETMPHVDLLQMSGDSSVEYKLIEWCKLFNASLGFLAIAAAAASLHPNAALRETTHKVNLQPVDKVNLKGYIKTDGSMGSNANSFTCTNSDLSNDSFFDSEPEDLTIRSTCTPKFLNPSHSRSQSPFE
ncbi:distal antenna-related [Haematobia irritans]|uniref:distal antenna-related n=1 Tax=Haematobia irritans TaxID=7368 RepID=UPI003F4F98DB